MATAGKKKEEKAGPSPAVQAGLLLVVSALAIGAGWLAGGMLARDSAAAATAEAGGQEGTGGRDGDAGPTHVGTMTPSVVIIDTITTNLAAPTDIWARLEVALVFADSPDPMIAEAVHQDLLAYLRTVKLHQIEGPSGFRHLKSDLEERAAIRSEGKVTQILVRTLLFE